MRNINFANEKKNMFKLDIEQKSNYILKISCKCSEQLEDYVVQTISTYASHTCIKFFDIDAPAYVLKAIAKHMNSGNCLMPHHSVPKDTLIEIAQHMNLGSYLMPHSSLPKDTWVAIAQHMNPGSRLCPHPSVPKDTLIEIAQHMNPGSCLVPKSKDKETLVALAQHMNPGSFLGPYSSLPKDIWVSIAQHMNRGSYLTVHSSMPKDIQVAIAKSIKNGAHLNLPKEASDLKEELEKELPENSQVVFGFEELKASKQRETCKRQRLNLGSSSNSKLRIYGKDEIIAMAKNVRRTVGGRNQTAKSNCAALTLHLLKAWLDQKDPQDIEPAPGRVLEEYTQFIVSVDDKGQVASSAMFLEGDSQTVPNKRPRNFFEGLCASGVRIVETVMIDLNNGTELCVPGKCYLETSDDLESMRQALEQEGEGAFGFINFARERKFPVKLEEGSSASDGRLSPVIKDHMMAWINTKDGLHFVDPQSDQGQIEGDRLITPQDMSKYCTGHGFIEKTFWLRVDNKQVSIEKTLGPTVKLES